MARRAFQAAAVIALAMTAGGCTRKWWLSVVGTAGASPVFCFSSKPQCRGGDVQFDLIDVTETDRAGNRLGPAWLIQGESASNRAYSLRRVTYGVPPPGWAELRPEKPLQQGHYYSVNGEYFITPLASGGFRVQTRSEFYRR